MYAPVETEGQAVTEKDINDDGKDDIDDDVAVDIVVWLCHVRVHMC